LVPRSGNTNKLIIAGALVRVVAAIVPGARVLVDSWYMRGRFLLPLFARGMRILGLRDTALFLPPASIDPTARWRRGRPRKYGAQVTPDQIEARAVWYEFFDHKKQAWSQRRLLLATELQLEPAQVMHFYSLRWGIESVFQNLKRWWGANNLWQ
ncbi:MAG: transposase, partial [Burkholderiales bacterium]|nr:transposase [Burkholderiales bacterium]